MDSGRYNIEDLILRFFNGECTAGEQDELARWKASSAENGAQFNIMRDIWLGSQEVKLPENISVTEELGKLRSRINAQERPAVKKRPGRTLLHYVSAAVVLLAAGTAISIYLVRGPATHQPSVARADSVYKVNFETNPGSIASVRLPDGSSITLNSASKINYRTDFGLTERTVELDGEAYFDVVSDSGKPFVVKVKDVDVIATGTSFNVSGYAGDRLITATLESGELKITGISRNNSPYTVSLSPAQTVMISTEADDTGRTDYLNALERSAVELTKDKDVPVARIADLNTELFTSWKDERWIVENETIGSLSDKLQRRYNVTIRFRNPEAADYNFTGTFENETIEEIMGLLSIATPIRYTIERGTIYISKDARRSASFR